MTNLFPAFAKTVADSFQSIAKSAQVFVTGIDGDELYDRYLRAFPEGTNPIFKKTTEHCCSTCRHFIRRAGNVVSVDALGLIHTVWDDAASTAQYPYNVVASILRATVLGKDISDLFRVSQKEYNFGATTTCSLDNGKALTWDHLHTGTIPSALQVDSPDQVRGDYRTTVQVFERGLLELAPSALETVLALIESNNLYRGAEHKHAVVQFMEAQRTWQSKLQGARHVFAWTHAAGPASRFRNTVIGTLVQDISDGIDLERAVASFESKVAPTNYKRTSAVITPAMVKKAMETIEALGLESALERRFAVIGDISVNDVLWVDGSVKPLMKGGLADTLMKVATAANPLNTKKDEERAEDIGLDAFVEQVLPVTTSMEVLLKGEHLGNLMSLTAPVHPEPKRLFRWQNDFAWSYSGNVADSYLRKQVQSLGGRVDGVLRFSHMWNHEKRNASLMDLHVFMPGIYTHRDGCHDVYPICRRVGWNMRSDRGSGGVQDVDYVTPAPEGYIPVENITFPSLDKLQDGDYIFKIHNWQLRQPTQGGFRAEIEFAGRIFQYDHPEPLLNKEWVTLAVVTLKGGVFTIEHKHAVGASAQNAWGLTTEQYVKVDAVTLSPNYWGDNPSGNKHTFFILSGCRNDEPTRGIYNEFLHPRLQEHRKVFEVIGDKTKCAPIDGALSGLGFSSTKKTNFLARVQQGKKQRIFNVHVGA